MSVVLPRCVIFVGFMGAGKSGVGRGVADRIGWSFRDADQAVEEHEGRSLSEIFRVSGEEHFRRVEAEVTLSLLQGEGIVIAAGGGWGAVPGRLAALPDDVCSVWLRVSPQRAVARVRGDSVRRPLLEHAADPSRVAASLLAEREPHYADARFHVDTDGMDVDGVVAAVLSVLIPTPNNSSTE
ncbi:MAG: shikimate kinase [Gemmatimonadota bacterium]|nr:shikimate kinase [Gemmatimonadota bacterium]MDH5758843.1 shikimate kinase [Gemmatimonadota bacterium]